MLEVIIYIFANTTYKHGHVHVIFVFLKDFIRSFETRNVSHDETFSSCGFVVRVLKTHTRRNRKCVMLIQGSNVIDVLVLANDFIPIVCGRKLMSSGFWHVVYPKSHPSISVSIVPVCCWLVFQCLRVVCLSVQCSSAFNVFVKKERLLE